MKITTMQLVIGGILVLAVGFFGNQYFASGRGGGGDGAYAGGGTLQDGQSGGVAMADGSLGIGVSNGSFAKMKKVKGGAAAGGRASGARKTKRKTANISPPPVAAPEPAAPIPPVDSPPADSQLSPVQYLVTAASLGGGRGTISSDPAGMLCGLDCQINYPAGTMLTLTASPAQGSLFVGWSGACQSEGNSPECSFMVSNPVMILANFDVALNSPGSFSASPINYSGDAGSGFSGPSGSPPPTPAPVQAPMPTPAPVATQTPIAAATSAPTPVATASVSVVTSTGTAAATTSSFWGSVGHFFTQVASTTMGVISNAAGSAVQSFLGSLIPK